MTQKTVFVITDPGLYPDDILNAWLLVCMQQPGLLKVVGAIANYSPSLMRARLLKGIFNQLGVDVPVAQGTNCNSEHQPREYEFDFPLADESEIIKEDLLKTTLEKAENNSITLQLISGLTDIWNAIQNYPDLLHKKTKEVYIMGGASWTEQGLIVDPTASNNKFDKSLDPQRVYKFFVSECIPLNVLTRYAAYAASITPEFYLELRGVNLIGKHLESIQHAAINSLWNFACANPPEHRQNRQWFTKTFCDCEDIPIDDGESPWGYVKNLSIYDPLTSLWMVRPDLFKPSTKTIYNQTHSIVGLSPEENGIVDKVNTVNTIKNFFRFYP
jgi:inosine-uridine nucleoside N-ribohydrolase